jgi:hypothetical protein
MCWGSFLLGMMATALLMYAVMGFINKASK